MSLGAHDPRVLTAAAAGIGSRRRMLLRRLTIRCPVTGTPADTGYELSSIPTVATQNLLVDCTECGQDHLWQVEDAFLD
jgi:hypothetical protein